MADFTAILHLKIPKTILNNKCPFLKSAEKGNGMVVKQISWDVTPTPYRRFTTRLLVVLNESELIWI
jgi:hypothetical protein